MTIQEIQALGNLLEFYYTDLIYIRNFQKYKAGEIDKTEYLKKEDGTFRSFLNEYRVARNVDKTKTEELLQLTTEWVRTNKSTDVDAFAKHLKESGITHGKTMKSLASKILFLNNPWKIIPFDSLAKKAVKLQENDYSEYLKRAMKYQEDNESYLNNCLGTVEQHLITIEQKFEGKLEDILRIRQNRFLDKVLWTIGR